MRKANQMIAVGSCCRTEASWCHHVEMDPAYFSQRGTYHCAGTTSVCNKMHE